MSRELWSRIDRTRPEPVDPALHALAIGDELVEEGTESTLEWAKAFDRAMQGLYTWKLWGAAFYAFGGCSDDSFEYFRAWLIGQGEERWNQARDDPEQLLVSLLGDSSDPDETWSALRIDEGEHLLYAAGRAHEILTGEWITGSSAGGEPVGPAWEEEQLPDLYPRLKSVLPNDWWSVAIDQSDYEPDDGVVGRIQRGLISMANGDHQAAIDELDVLVTDPAMWDEVPDLLRGDVAYAVGITRLMEGLLDAATTALLLVEDEFEDNDSLRRAMAQIELARGDLGRAANYIDGREDAHRMDRVLTAKLAFRNGNVEEAAGLARQELLAVSEGLEHPWDLAGAAYQAGAILVEAGDLAGATEAVQQVADLLEGAPCELPLQLHLRILRAGVGRLSGRHFETLVDLDRLCTEATGSELAESLRERARVLRTLGRHEESRTDYTRAVSTFESTGEIWEARATAREAEAL